MRKWVYMNEQQRQMSINPYCIPVANLDTLQRWGVGFLPKVQGSKIWQREHRALSLLTCAFPSSSFPVVFSSSPKTTSYLLFWLCFHFTLNSCCCSNICFTRFLGTALFVKKVSKGAKIALQAILLSGYDFREWLIADTIKNGHYITCPYSNHPCFHLLFLIIYRLEGLPWLSSQNKLILSRSLTETSGISVIWPR